MKKKFITWTVFSLIAVASAGFLSYNRGSLNAEFLSANVEALAQNENASPECDTGFCGRCWEVKRFGFLYKCVWTGDPNDFCDCIYIGYV